MSDLDVAFPAWCEAQNRRSTGEAALEKNGSEVLDELKCCAVRAHNLLEMVAGTVRKSKSDIVLSTLAVSLYTE
jgi:hypothetical protein